MEVVRGKIECLRFIPDSELGVQHVDEGNQESNYCGMFVPGQGWKAPTSEPESLREKKKRRMLSYNFKEITYQRTRIDN